MVKNNTATHCMILDQMHHRGLVGETDFTVSDVAKWCHASVPTARRYLSFLESEGLVSKSVTRYRSNATKHLYRLSDETFLKAGSGGVWWSNIQNRAKSFYSLVKG